MNYLAAFDDRWYWTSVEEPLFVTTMETFDYMREHWSDVTVYKERHSPYRELGFFTTRHAINPHQFYVRPGVL